MRIIVGKETKGSVVPKFDRRIVLIFESGVRVGFQAYFSEFTPEALSFISDKIKGITDKKITFVSVTTSLESVCVRSTFSVYRGETLRSALRRVIRVADRRIRLYKETGKASGISVYKSLDSEKSTP